MASNNNLLLPIDSLNQSTLRKIASKRDLISDDILINDTPISTHIPTSKYQYKIIYIYNAITGQLWRRCL